MPRQHHRNRWGSLAVAAAVAWVAAGCDVVSTKETAARNLYERVAQGDCLAFQELSVKSTQKDKWGAAFYGLALQTGLGGGCKDQDLLALAAYEDVLGKIPEVDFNAGLILIKVRKYQAAEVALVRAAGGEKKTGLTRAMVKLAQIYELGLAGFPNSDSLAAAYYEAASRQGDLHARFKLGTMFYTGKGVTRDMAKGQWMLENAAELGYKPARVRLFELNDAGITPEAQRRPEVAAKWLGAAALLDEGLIPRYEAYLRTLAADERGHVVKQVQKFAMSVKKEWKDDSYDQPLRPE